MVKLCPLRQARKPEGKQQHGNHAGWRANYTCREQATSLVRVSWPWGQASSGWEKPFHEIKHIVQEHRHGKELRSKLSSEGKSELWMEFHPENIVCIFLLLLKINENHVSSSRSLCCMINGNRTLLSPQHSVPGNWAQLRLQKMWRDSFWPPDLRLIS